MLSAVYVVQGTDIPYISCLYSSFGGTKLRTPSPKSLPWQTLPLPITSLTTGDWNHLLNTALSPTTLVP